MPGRWAPEARRPEPHSSHRRRPSGRSCAVARRGCEIFATTSWRDRADHKFLRLDRAGNLVGCFSQPGR